MTETTYTGRPYQREFSADFQVPALIDALVAQGEISDTSWHNDVAPSFTYDEQATLFVDHPVAYERELNVARYTVINGEAATVLFSSETDLRGALLALGVPAAVVDGPKGGN